MMKSRKQKLVIVLVLLIPFGSAFAERQWLTEDEYANLHIVLSSAASKSEQYAAKEFSALWQTCTGHEPSASEQADTDRVNVWIGVGEDPFIVEDELEGLGDDGLIIRTQGPRLGVFRRLFRRQSFQTKGLIIAGEGTRGTLYGVYQFFEDYMGVRWLTPEFTHVPCPPKAIPRIDTKYVPKFSYRDVSYRSYINHPDFAARHRMNGFWAKIPAEMGGNISYLRDWPGLGHTFHYYVNPEEYFDEHPEYFSEINGQRQRFATQLCLTNKDVLAITIEKVRTLLREAAPNQRIVSISQMDMLNWCECDKCSAIDAHEDSHAGALVHFINSVAEAVEDEFPDAFIDTFAYFYSQKPPKHVKPRSNVIIRLCSSQCDFSRPLSYKANRLNSAFRKDIEAWGKIAEHLFVWDYTQNWYCFQGPHPNFHVFQPNAEFYAKQGVEGLFEQASPTSPHSDFEFLKGYILSHCLWDPDADWRKLYSEFLELYYGEAAPFIREYHDLITKRVLKEDFEMIMFNTIDWMDFDTVEKAGKIFERAFESVQDEAVLERLRYAHLPVQYSALVCPPRIRTESDKYVLTRPPSQTFDEYWDMIMGYGVTDLADWKIDAFRGRLNSTTPPRYEEVPIEKLENDRYEVWIVPTLGAAIVRFRCKKPRVELFSGYESIISDEGRCAEWMYPAEEGPYGPGQFRGLYEVVDRQDDSIIMEAYFEEGLVIKKRVSLGDSLKIELELRNEGEEALNPRITMRPQFQVRGKGAPELWVERNGQWSQRQTDQEPGETGSYAHIDPKGVTRLACKLPGKRLTLINEVRGEQLMWQAYYFNPFTKSFKIELIPPFIPLEPGKTWSIHASYSLTKDRPFE